MKTLLLFSLMVCTVQASTITPEQFYPYIARWEGERTEVYHRGGEACVGIGHELKGTHSKTIYSAAEIESLYEADFAQALLICQNGIKNFDYLPIKAQIVCMSLVWTVGPEGFHFFYRFRRQLNDRHYAVAALELVTSKRDTQIGAVRAQEEWTMLTSIKD